MGRDGAQQCRPDSKDPVQAFEVPEGTPRRPVCCDPLGQRNPNARKSCDFRDRCLIHIDTLTVTQGPR
jgi:hypothetical protein